MSVVYVMNVECNGFRYDMRCAQQNPARTIVLTYNKCEYRLVTTYFHNY